MVVFSVLYPATEGARFDHDYYDQTHVPMVREAFADTGLTGVQVFRGLNGPGGAPPPYVLMAHVSFESLQSLQASLSGPQAVAVFADIARFTDIAPFTQVSAVA